MVELMEKTKNKKIHLNLVKEYIYKTKTFVTWQKCFIKSQFLVENRKILVEIKKY